MINARLLTVPFLLTTVALTVAQEPKRLITSDLTGKELSFLLKAGEQGQMLGWLTDLAKMKSSSEPVRALADLLGTTQAKETEQLLALAQKKGVPMATTAPAAVPRLKAILDPLEKQAFDAAWLTQVGDVIKASIQTYTSGSTVKDEAIQKFASNGLALANQKLEVLEKVAKR